MAANRWIAPFAATAALLILAPLCRAEINPASRLGDKVDIFHCTFDQRWDENYDQWPDRWVRKTGPQYAHYVEMEIRDEPDAVGQRCLAIKLDGAAAGLLSPKIRVISRFSYELGFRLRSENIEHSTIVLSASFYDAQGELLHSLSSKPLQELPEWTHVGLGPVGLDTQAVDHVVIGLEVTPGRHGDLHGRVLLDDVWLARLPRMIVRTNSRFNVYNKADDVVITCDLSGIREREPEIRFQLLDYVGEQLSGGKFRLSGRLIVEDSRQTSDIVDGVGHRPAGYEGSMQWRPPIPDYGFYRVVVRMLSTDQESGRSDEEREMSRREITLAVVPNSAPPLDRPRQGEFGWTLPRAGGSMSLQELTELLPQVGVHWVKLPVWFDYSQPRTGDEIVRFAELLSASDIEVVGVIDRPPQNTELGARAGSSASIAEVLSFNPEQWQASLDPVMNRLALRVRWWQLGGDRDDSFATYPNLNTRMATLRKELFRFGQEVQLGLVWNWEAQRPPAGNVRWDFEQTTGAPMWSSEQLAAFLSSPQVNSARRWIVVSPLPTSLSVEQAEALALTRGEGGDSGDQAGRIGPFSAEGTEWERERASEPFGRPSHFNGPSVKNPGTNASSGSDASSAWAARPRSPRKTASEQRIEVGVEDRIRNLVLQIVTAKQHGAEAIFASHPFDDELGLMRADGAPGELLLPWRTAAHLLAGSTYIGKLQLPEHSQNRVFQRANGQVVMVVWNPEPAQEILYLGEKVVQIDCWGRTVAPESDEHRQIIEVGPLPSFVVGLNEPVARWRMACQFEEPRVPSIFGETHPNRIRITNTFPQGAGGRLSIFVPRKRLPGGRESSPYGRDANIPSDHWSMEPDFGEFGLTPGEAYEVPFDVRLKEASLGPQPVRVDFEIEADQLYRFSVYRDLHVGTGEITMDVRSHLDEEGTLLVEQFMMNTAERPIDFKCYLYGAKDYRRQRTQVYRLGPAGDRKVYRFPNGKSLLGTNLMLEAVEIDGARVLKYEFTAGE